VRRDVVSDDEALCHASLMRCCVGKVFGFNHKIMINVQESLPSIMVTRNLWSASLRRGLVV
jgi:hypothetical protein